MSWNLVVTKPAQKDLRNLPARDRERVIAALEAMREDPFTGDIVRLKAQPSAWRRRVGSYRILYDLYPDEALIVIAGVVRRTSTTY